MTEIMSELFSRYPGAVTWVLGVLDAAILSEGLRRLLNG